jgi:hypothetical protein
MLRQGADIKKDEVFGDLRQYTYNNVRFDYNNLAEYEYLFGVSAKFQF